MVRVIVDMQQCMAHEIDRVRAEPDEMLLSRLANLDTDEQKLNHRELQGLNLQILVAGNETTTTTLAPGMRIPIERLDLAAAIRANPSLAKMLGMIAVIPAAKSVTQLFVEDESDSQMCGMD